jgi:hypothetical protein
VVYSAGDFVDDYAVRSDERNDQSFVFLLDIRDGLPRRLRLRPTVIEDLRARTATVEARAVARRMERLSAALGTACTWHDDEQCLDVPLS